MKLEAYSKTWFSKQTKLYYDSTRTDQSSFKNLFNNFFDLPYELVFRNESYQSSLYNLLEKYYKNEEIVKAKFVSTNANCKRNFTFFEFPVKNSRIDIVSLGDKSFAYEVKTKYDTLDRLSKQLNDYLKCFEYVYVIISDDRLDEVAHMIPTEVGIYTFKDKSTSLNFRLIKKAELSSQMNFEYILDLFTKNYLKKYFLTENRNLILSNFSIQQINKLFKLMIVDKYKGKNVSH